MNLLNNRKFYYSVFAFVLFFISILFIFNIILSDEESNIDRTVNIFSKKYSDLQKKIKNHDIEIEDDLRYLITTSSYKKTDKYYYFENCYIQVIKENKKIIYVKADSIYFNKSKPKKLYFKNIYTLNNYRNKYFMSSKYMYLDIDGEIVSSMGESSLEYFSNTNIKANEIILDYKNQYLIAKENIHAYIKEKLLLTDNMKNDYQYIKFSTDSFYHDFSKNQYSLKGNSYIDGLNISYNGTSIHFYRESNKISIINGDFFFKDKKEKSYYIKALKSDVFPSKDNMKFIAENYEITIEEHDFYRYFKGKAIDYEELYYDNSLNNLLMKDSYVEIINKNKNESFIQFSGKKIDVVYSVITNIIKLKSNIYNGKTIIKEEGSNIINMYYEKAYIDYFSDINFMKYVNGYGTFGHFGNSNNKLSFKSKNGRYLKNKYIKMNGDSYIELNKYELNFKSNKIFYYISNKKLYTFGNTRMVLKSNSKFKRALCYKSKTDFKSNFLNLYNNVMIKDKKYKSLSIDIKLNQVKLNK